MTTNTEALELFQAQQDLRHENGCVRDEALLPLLKLALSATHRAVRDRALDVLADTLGCDLTRTATGISARTPAAAAARVGRAAAR